MSKSKECIDIMVDIETLGKSPGSVILSIGAVAFDIGTGEINDKFYGVIDLESSLHNGLKVDASTILWWMSDDQQEARNEILKAHEDHGATDICEILIKFSDFIEKNREDDKNMRVWANPPSFDMMILDTAFDVLYMDIPWKYHEMMDFRTIKNIYEGDRPEFKISGIKHNALYDATLQAKICSYVWNRIKKRL